ncbi:MAG: succinate dehydrogenase and fumarate reductase iron-sulfur protein [Gammaproteobacteria bacterium]|nr:succinate dehydrogenase and fumarate reductase iron-sulfur protein [Gammaproteobacteria bacterium]
MSEVIGESTTTTAVQFSIYRYNPDKDEAPYMQEYTLNVPAGVDTMLLTALLRIKDEQDPTLSLRRSCREGVCGSDGMNVNGRNCLACITPLSSLAKRPIVVRPLPGLPVMRDLIVDMEPFFDQYKKVKPWLQNENPPAKEHLQSPQERELLDGLYECILCACCSSSCPSFWWNPDKFLGPAALLQAYRFLTDSRDKGRAERLKDLSDPYSVFRCRSIMNCVDVCPKGLNPTKAIGKIRKELLKEEI